ncbi:hypothetical protein Tsubulata_038685 [Turnera subulata]|uniref:UBC core domain-containing protein n=1 Tax=Turnera subulata TaxID=218843 RepID=A0A9Q0G747_9ROSI|nr:hypothetical protein Tsubulata_038685 [Turnera subulata]
MEMRTNPTVDNSPQHHHHHRRHAPPAAPSKQPACPPNTVDTTSVTQRLQKELMSLMMAGGDLGVSAFPEGESIFNWIGTIVGGKGTAYEGLSYKLSLCFPPDYPFKPPQVRFVTMCFHPNVDQFGNICLDILQNPIQKVHSTAMLPNYGLTRKIIGGWSGNSIMPEKSLRVDCRIQNSDDPLSIAATQPHAMQRFKQRVGLSLGMNSPFNC